MKLLQIGVPKSGNYWLYNIIQSIYKIKGIKSESYIKKQPVYREAVNWDLSHHQQAGIDMMDIQRGKCFYRISSVIREPVENLDEYINSSNHIWTHSEVCANIEPVLEKFDKLVYIYRDPRDMAISAARYAFTPYMRKYYPHDFDSFESYLDSKLPEIIHYWMWHVTDYLLMKRYFNIYFIAYENLLEDFDEVASALAAYLELDLNNRQIAQLRKSVSFHKMQKKDPRHVSKGKRMQWPEVLSREQQNLVIEMAGRLLSLLRYPLGEYDQMPVNANKLSKKEIERVAEKLKYSTVNVQR